MGTMLASRGPIFAGVQVGDAATQALIDDAAADVRVLAADQKLDRILRPWAYTDAPPSWGFEPFPRVERLRRWWAR